MELAGCCLPLSSTTLALLLLLISPTSIRKQVAGKPELHKHLLMHSGI